MRKNSIALSAVLLVLSVLVTACASYGPPEAGETIVTSPPPVHDTGSAELPPGVTIRPSVDPDAVAAANLAALPEADMEEATFLILTTRKEAIIPTVDPNEEEGRKVDVAVLERNERVEKKYNVRLMCLEVPREDLQETIADAVGLNLYLADLLEIPSDFLGIVASKKLTVNMQTLPCTDYAQAYFNADAIAQCSAGNFTYAVAGNANAYESENLCLYFRADLLGEMSADALYRAAYEGEWDWETLLTLASGTKDGMTCLALPDSIKLSELVLGSSTVHLLQAAYGAFPIAGEEISEVQAVVDVTTRLIPLANSKVGAAEFSAGQVMFYVGTASEHGRFADIPYDWGILPLPKLSASQSEYRTIGDYRTLFTAVKTMGSAERSGLILQALNASSAGQVTEILISEALLGSVRCADAANMFELFLGSIEYDFGHMMQIGYASIKAASVDAFEGAIAGEGSFAELYGKAEANLKKDNAKNFKLE